MERTRTYPLLATGRGAGCISKEETEPKQRCRGKLAVLGGLAKLAKVMALAGLMMLFFTVVIGPVVLIGMVDGSLFPIQAYSMLNQALGQASSYRLETAVSAGDSYGVTSVEEMRDLSFELYGINPQAQRWMDRLPLRYEESNQWAGAYDPAADSVAVSRYSPPVFLHEYAHANLHHQPPLEKLKFAVSLIYLWFDADPHDHGANLIARGDLARAARPDQGVLVYNPFQEAYANLAIWSDGNLRRIPSFLQPYYAGYLQPGTNEWIRQTEDSGSTKIHQTNQDDGGDRQLVTSRQVG